MCTEEEKIPLLILAGPTASGKTSLSIELARKLNGETISADSMQVYRGMDIGTAKVTPEEMDGIPHHLIDICDPISKSPEEEWNVMRFVREADTLIHQIHARGHLPMLVGGTGFRLIVLGFLDLASLRDFPGIELSVVRNEGIKLFVVFGEVDV